MFGSAGCDLPFRRMSATIPGQNSALILPPRRQAASDVPRFDPVAGTSKDGPSTVSTRLCGTLSQARLAPAVSDRTSSPVSRTAHVPSRSYRKLLLKLRKSRQDML